MEQRTKLYQAGDQAGIDALEQKLLTQNAQYKSWTCSEEMMKRTKNGSALYLHCLPADITGLSCPEGEVANSVFDRYLVPLYKQASFKPYITDFAIYNGDDIMLLPTIVQGAMGLVSGGAHIFGHEIRAIFNAFAAGDNQKAKELFVPIYRFCKSTGQNGRILPNSILRPAIEAVTGVKLGPARSPLAPATQEEMRVTLGILKEIGKL